MLGDNVCKTPALSWKTQAARLAGVERAAERLDGTLERVLSAHREWVESVPTTTRAAVFDILDDKRAQAIEDYGKDVRSAVPSYLAAGFTSRSAEVAESGRLRLWLSVSLRALI